MVEKSKKSSEEGIHCISISNTNGSGATHVILVRHGQSENNVIESEVGDTPEFYTRRSIDPKLSALGHQQAFLLGERGLILVARDGARGKIKGCVTLYFIDDRCVTANS